MGDVINLRQARKARARADREKAAEQNRAKFGRTKGQKSRDEANKSNLEKEVEGARRVDRISESDIVDD